MIDLIIARSILDIGSELVSVVSIITELAGMHPSVGLYLTGVDFYSLEPRDYTFLLEICEMIGKAK